MARPIRREERLVSSGLEGSEPPSTHSKGACGLGVTVDGKFLPSTRGATMLIHPLVVHFPVALWIVSLLFDVLAWYRQDPLYRRAAYLLVGLGVVGAVISIGSGWFDLLGYERGGVDPGIVYRHWIHSILAYASTVAYLANFVWRWRRDNRLTGALLSLSILGAILIAVAGYLGGALRSAM